MFGLEIDSSQMLFVQRDSRDYISMSISTLFHRLLRLPLCYPRGCLLVLLPCTKYNATKYLCLNLGRAKWSVSDKKPKTSQLSE